MEDERLVFAYAEPVIRQIRGRQFEIKSMVAANLSPGMRALLMFQVVYGHAKEGALRFLCSISYLLARDGMWQALRSGPRYFGDERLVCLLATMEQLYCAVSDRMENGILENMDAVLAATRGDAKLAATILDIDVRLAETLRLSVSHVAGYIRRNPHEFTLPSEHPDS